MSEDTLKKTFSTKGLTGIIVALLVLMVANFLPTSEALSREGVLGLGIMISAVILWFCESFPAGVTGILMLVLAAAFQVVPMSQVFTGFAGSTIFFVIGVFSLTVLMMKTNLGQRLTRRLIMIAGTNQNKLVLAFMSGALIISTIMTDTGSVIITAGLALPFLKAIGHSPGNSRLGKCIMIGVAFAAVLGGFCTPVGHSMNVLGLGMLAEGAQISVGFFQWMLIGIPFAIIMLPICWFFLIKILKPEKVSQEALDKVFEATEGVGKLTTVEKKALVMLIGIPILWIIGNWVPILDVTTVAIIGLAIMFLPGVDLLTWDDMQKGVPWNIILMIGSILSLGGILSETGGAAYIANLFLSSGILNLDPFAALLLIATVVYALHTVFPVAPAFLTIFLPPLFVYAEAVGISPTIPMMIIVLMVSGNYIIPINPTITVAYAKGYFTFGDVAKSGIFPAILFVFIGTTWIYFMGGLIGI